jgi:hypothetical protein
MDRPRIPLVHTTVADIRCSRKCKKGVSETCADWNLAQLRDVRHDLLLAMMVSRIDKAFQYQTTRKPPA